MNFKAILSNIVLFFTAWTLIPDNRNPDKVETVPIAVPVTVPVAVPEAKPIDPASYHEFALTAGKAPCQALEAYRNPDTREAAVEFFSSLIGSRELTVILLRNASAFDLDPALVFALCWVESHYNRYAVNSKNVNGSIDRGLFQLNDRSFPSLSVEEFFNPSINTYIALESLRTYINLGGSEVAGLAMYNAGPVRVRKGATPQKTLNYIASINNYREGITALFRKVHSSSV
jgi:soluble lytic murein transglycosylase-like protein